VNIGRKDPLERLRAATVVRDTAGLRRRLRPRTAEHHGLIDLASNDYLGLSRDPRLVEGAIRAAREWGVGSGGSRLVTGTTELHAALDARLAEFVGAPAGLVFSSGYLANLGAITSLSGPGTLVVSDQGEPRVDRGRLPAVPVTNSDHATS
jgi:7-keto-8-aminopelargonate synthetase and related enzymes